MLFKSPLSRLAAFDFQTISISLLVATSVSLFEKERLFFVRAAMFVFHRSRVYLILGLFPCTLVYRHPIKTGYPDCVFPLRTLLPPPTDGV